MAAGAEGDSAPPNEDNEAEYNEDDFQPTQVVSTAIPPTQSTAAIDVSPPPVIQNGPPAAPPVVIGSLAHQIACQNAKIWADTAFEPQRHIQSHQIVIAFPKASAVNQAEKLKHFRLMGLTTLVAQEAWIRSQIKRLHARITSDLQSAAVLLEMAACNGGNRYGLAVERWTAAGMPKKSILADDLRGDKRDFQGLNWLDLTGSTAAEGRVKRLQVYNKLEARKRPEVPLATDRLYEFCRSEIPASANFMKFRRFDFRDWKKPKTAFAKPAERNAIAVGPNGSVFYKSRKGNSVLWNNFELPSPKAREVLTLLHPDGEGNENDEVEISAIAAKHGVLVAGSQYGEYAIRSTTCNLTDRTAQITNFIEGAKPPMVWNKRRISHVDIVKAYNSDLPQAMLASGDGCIYTLDCNTGKLIGGGKWYGGVADNRAWGNMCTAQSPNRRLRAIVGSYNDVIIAAADEGKVLERLTGHYDSNTCCTWSENGIHLATGGFDKLVKIWDARMWKNSDGTGRPLATIASKLSPVMGLEFSPVGLGRRCLMMREEADVISFIDARTFKEQQSIEVLGQLIGGGWSEDGQRVMVGVQDDLVGGMLTLKRCGWGQGDEYAQDDTPPKGPPIQISEAIRNQRSDNENALAELSDWTRHASYHETVQRQFRGKHSTRGDLYEMFKDLNYGELKFELRNLIDEAKRLFCPPHGQKGTSRKAISANEMHDQIDQLLYALPSSAAYHKDKSRFGRKVTGPPLFAYRYDVYEGLCEDCGELFRAEVQKERHVCPVFEAWFERKEMVMDRCLSLYRELEREVFGDEERDEDGGRVEERRGTSEMYWRRKAARAGDFGDLL